MTVDVDVTEKKRSLGLSQHGLVVGFIGWLLTIKGPLHLLRAMETVWQDFPDAQLVFIGKGDLDIELRTAAINSIGNGQVKFLGWRDDIHEIIPAFDILVLPSLNEGMGRVLIEAMAAGKPVVASNTGGIPDLVKHEYNGLLVPPGDQKALAASIRQLIIDSKKAKLMGQHGREFCHQFSLDAMVEKIDDLYEDLLAFHQPMHPKQSEPSPLQTDYPDERIPMRGKHPLSGQDVHIEN